MRSPSSLRRAVMVPLVVLFECLLIGCSPVLLLAACVVAAACRSSRPVRSVLLVVAYAVIELEALARIAREDVDWDTLVRDVLDAGLTAMRRILDVRLVLEEGSADPAAVRHSDGLVVLSRHCGPGDTVFVAWLLAAYYCLSLRVVLKRALRWEPAVDLAGDALPLCFVAPGGGRAGVEQIAAGLSRGDALLLFPEGGNFSWDRWREAVARLTARGLHLQARVARRRTHTLPPRPGGAVAALAAAPRADVLLVAHSGFGPDGRDRPWWRLPVHHDLVVRTLLLPAGRVPRDEEGARRFLETAWAQVDTWVEGHADLLRTAAGD